MLASLTGDRFLPPTRAPRELAAALRLQREQVPTPEILAYAVYHAGPLFRRSDVVTREVRNGLDLAQMMTEAGDGDRRVALEAAAELIGLLSAAGARHHDLNLKNILVAREGARAGRLLAFVLDVDRVEFGRGGDSRITELNLARFARSARKWRELYGARIDEAELARVAATVRRVAMSRPSSARPPRTRS